MLIEFANLKCENLPLGLPPTRDIQHHINFVSRSSIPNRLTYHLNSKEFEELQHLLTKLLERGYIQESMSPCTVPSLLVHKKDGLWRMCIDSKAINWIMVKYRLSIPCFDDMLNQLSSSKVFSKLNLGEGIIKSELGLKMSGKQRSRCTMGCTSGWSCLLDYPTCPNTFMRFMHKVLQSNMLIFLFCFLFFCIFVFFLYLLMVLK